MKATKKPAIVLTEDIVSLSEFKAKASKVINKLSRQGRSIIITQNGKPSAVVITPEEFDRLREREAFIAAVEDGLREVEQGRPISTKDLEKQLDKRYGKLK